MKKRTAEKISMIDDFMYTEQKEWLKKIRVEIQNFRQAHSKTTKNNNRLTSCLLDLEPAMEKRRINALLSSLEKLSDHDKHLAGDWITVNIFSESYTPIQCDGHILTAASIWILDKLNELNIPFDKIYPLLPTDEELIDDLFDVDIWDCQYDDTLILSVEYVLRYRNSDISPLESDGSNGKRVLTSNLAAEGKDHASVPSRIAFENLLNLLPQYIKDNAVKQFNMCHQILTERFFTGIRYYQKLYHEKRETVNAIRSELNNLHDKMEKKSKQIIAERKKMKKSKKIPQIKPAVFLNPAQTITELSSLPPINSFLSDSPISSTLKEPFGYMGDPEVFALINSFKELDKKHDDAMNELNDIIEKRGKFLHTIVHRGYFTREFVSKHFPEELYDALLKPLPVSDPYEMCFALLYLIEIGNDIPWLYGSCIGMMYEVIDYLPWGMSDYDEMMDPYWKEVPPASCKTPDFPDWYKRDYYWKGDDEYNARNLAQILYEATGCLMPRNLNRYNSELKNLGKYGIKQNKAISMLYCMLALSNSRRRACANNFEPDYMRLLLPETDAQDTADKNKTTPLDWIEQKTALEKEIQQLKAALHSAEKAANQAKKQLEQQKSAAEAEHRELADLREIIFNKEDSESDSKETERIDNKIYPYTVNKSTVVFGGHETWVKSLKPLLKGDIKFIPREMKIDASLVRYADVIWIQTNAIPHRSYYSIINTARKLGKPIRYFKNAGSVKCAEQIVENDNQGK